MESFLLCLLPRLLPANVTFAVYVHQGKDDLLTKLNARLRGYADWLPDEWRIVGLVDRDDDDCVYLKAQLETAAATAGLRTKTSFPTWQLVNRIAVEELEAWYFGEWSAVIAAYPRVNRHIPDKAPYRDCDDIRGGTWEAFHRVTRMAGYYPTGLLKSEAARSVGSKMDPWASTSRSFICFRDALLAATSPV